MAIAFWLSDGNGAMYFFNGSWKMGVDTLNGQGQWTYLPDPTVTDQWHIFHMVPSRGACSGT